MHGERLVFLGCGEKDMAAYALCLHTWPDGEGKGRIWSHRTGVIWWLL